MAFETERARAEAALSSRLSDDMSPFPSSKHLTRATERPGLTEVELARPFGTEGYLCPDLERYDGEIFQCESVADLVHLAEVLGTSVSHILFGEDPPVPLAPIFPETVVEKLRA